MFIQTEQTPNPATLKFLPGRPVLEGRTRNFICRDDAKASPLAASLFDISGISGVFYGADFITVTKDESEDWQSLKPRILGAVMDHFVSGAPLLIDEPKAEEKAAPDSEADSDTVIQIKALIDEKIRPAVARDGGDIIFQEFSDGVVYLHMQGACAGCPSSTATLKHGIENLLRHYVPEVQEVRQI